MMKLRNKGDIDINIVTIMRHRKRGDIESNTNVTSRENTSEASEEKYRFRIKTTKNSLANSLALLLYCCLVIVVTFREYSTFDRHITFRSGSTVKADQHPNNTLALECLRKTKPDLPDLPYPQDAFEHFQEIHSRLEKWLNPATLEYAGYSGPWMENQWISHFQEELKSNDNSLSDVFGPYVPILVPWTDNFEGGIPRKLKYPDGLASALKEVLREDIMYITVVQNDDGFVGRCTEFDEIQKKFHITILSSGGYGHAAIPLLLQPEALFPKIPMEQREHRISYLGSHINAPYNMRERMIGMHTIFYDKTKNWREIMARSKFSLCPRGYGRTSFHVYETLQMGLIPIYVYLEDDIEWLPYGNAMKDISYSVTIEKLSDLITQLSTMPDSEIEKMEERIRLKRHLFTYEGVLEQISKFMLNPTGSDIVCNALPSHSGAGHSKPGEIVLREC